MPKLPKVDKGISTGLTKLERVRNVFLGVVLVAGLTIAATPPTSAKASMPSAPTSITNPSNEQGALLLTPSSSVQGQIQRGGHYSHSSHASHASHSSHQSHVSHYSSSTE